MIDKEMMERARKIAAEYKDPSGIFAIPNVSYFQRKLQISYIRATEIHYALYGAKKQTNGDRLRAMSNKELVGRMSFCPMCLDDKFPVCKGRGCKECKLDWLNSPADSEVNQNE